MLKSLVVVDDILTIFGRHFKSLLHINREPKGHYFGGVKNSLNLLDENVTFLSNRLSSNPRLLLNLSSELLHQNLDITQLVEIKIPLLFKPTDRFIGLRNLAFHFLEFTSTCTTISGAW